MQKSAQGVKGKVVTAENASVDDLIVICINGGIDILKAFFKGWENAGNILSLNNYNSRVTLFNKDCSTRRWNPFQYAVFYGHLEIITYFVQDLHIHILLALEVRRDKYEIEKDDLNL